MTEDDEFDVELLSVQDYDLKILKSWFTMNPENIKFLPLSCEISFEVEFSP